MEHDVDKDCVYDESATETNGWRHVHTDAVTMSSGDAFQRNQTTGTTSESLSAGGGSFSTRQESTEKLKETREEANRVAWKTLFDANGVETPGGGSEVGSEVGSVSFSGKSTHDVDTVSRSEAWYPDGTGTGSVSSTERDIVDQYEGGCEWERAYGDPDFGSGEPGYGSGSGEGDGFNHVWGSDETTYTTLTGDLSGAGDETQIVDGELSQGGYANTPPYDEHVHHESFRNGSVPTVYYAFTLTRGKTTGQNRGLGVD